MLIFYLQLRLLFADPHFQRTKLCCKTRKPSTAKNFLDCLGCVNSEIADDFSGFECYECLIAVRGDNVTSNMIYVHTSGAGGGSMEWNMLLWTGVHYCIIAFYPFIITGSYDTNNSDNVEKGRRLTHTNDKSHQLFSPDMPTEFSWGWFAIPGTSQSEILQKKKIIRNKIK